MSVAQDRAKSIFLSAAEITSPAECHAYVASRCGPDEALRREVEDLLRHQREIGSFLEPDAGMTIESPVPTERPGAVVGRYKLMEQLGEGGFGLVFVAEQQHPVRRKVALKLIKPGMDARGVIARFEAERQALAMMDHPNIAKVLDAGATELGRPYFVMELVPGVPITEYCDSHKLTPRQRLELFVSVCQAVQHAHTKGIIHRDLKPSNVLVAVHDDRPVPKVIDFGIAKATGQQLTDKTLFTQFAQMVGTPLYMSPEQAQMGGLDVDTRSDVYSLGVLLYELLAGSTPFDGRRIGAAALDEVRRIIREEEPPKPSTRLSTAAELPTIAASRGLEPKKLSVLVRGELDWIVMKALEKDRARRYESVNGFARDVERYLGDEAVQACPPSAGYRFGKFARRHRGALVTASLALLAVLLVAGTAGWAVRDRAVRRMTIAARAEQVLGESEAFYRQRNLPEAIQVARSALAQVRGGAGGGAVEQRASEWLADLEMASRLAEIHPRGEGDWKQKLVEYPRAFREYGIDIETLPEEEAAARIVARPIRVELAVALDRWVEYVFNWGGHMGLEGEKGVTLRRRLGRIARLADPDPLRNRLRDAYRDAGTGKDDAAELRELAASIDLVGTPIATLMLIGDSQEGPTGATEFYARVQRHHPNDFGVTFGLGRMLRIRGDWDGAVRFLTAAVAIRPQSHFARVELGHALRGGGRLDEAVITYRDAIGLRPGDVRNAGDYLHLGMAFEGKGLLDDAVASFREALRLAPNFFLAQCQLGVALAGQGKAEEAETALKEAIRMAPGHAPARHELGMLLEKKGKVDEAVAEYREAVRAWPHLALAHQSLGDVLERKGLLDEAVAAYREVIRLEPKAAFAHGQVGFILRRQGKTDEAIAAQRELLRLAPDAPHAANAHHELGHAHRNKGSLDEAIAAYREAVRLSPEVGMHHGSLGSALKQKGLVDEAIAACSEAVRLSPDLHDAHYSLGGAHACRGDWEQARAAFGRAAELRPVDLHSWYCYGTLCLLKGDVEGHRRACRAMLGRAAGTRHIQLADSTAKLCALAGDLAGDAGRVKALAATKVIGNEPPGAAQWFSVSQGLVEHRAGRFGAAVEAIGRSSPVRDGVHRDALAFSVLAMAHHREGKPDEARAALASAQRIIAAKMPDPAKGQRFGDDWHDWLHCQLLCREAERVLAE